MTDNGITDFQFTDPLGNHWKNGQWYSAEYLTCPVEFIAYNMFTILEKSQVRLFTWWNFVLGLSEDDPNRLEPIDTKNACFFGDEELDIFPSLHIDGTMQSKEGDNSCEDTYNLDISLRLQGDNPSERKRQASRYNTALRSLYTSAPIAEFFNNWPPQKMVTEGYRRIKSGKKFVNLDVPSTEGLIHRIGNQSILTIELIINASLHAGKFPNN
jgi:hypothetical protein